MRQKTMCLCLLLLLGCFLLAACGTTTSENSSLVEENGQSQITELEDDLEEDVSDMLYDPSKDNFYNQDTIYATWINVYSGSTEIWWKVWNDGETGVSGQKQLINGTYQSIDNNNPEHRQAVFEYTRDAGIDALIMDLTNGASKWLDACKDYQRMCHENGMKFATAINGSGKLESLCGVIWNQFANPEKSEYADSYLYKNGKPLIVLYCVRADFEAALQMESELVQKFEFVWASGEDSEVNKWGWQLEPTVGPIPSADSVFVTPAVKWYPFVPDGTSDSWRRSLAMLDFTFLAAQEQNAKYVIVGSFDDIGERNGWSINDTANAFYQWPMAGPFDNLIFARGLQNRNINGALDSEVYYSRVKDWLSGEAKAFHPGGILADGAYTITGYSGRMFGANRPVGEDVDLEAPIKSGFQVDTAMETYYWFYHLGDNRYRIIKLSSNLSLQAGATGLIQNWDDALESQVWTALPQENGTYLLINEATEQAMCDPAEQDAQITLETPEVSDVNQQWVVTPVQNRQLAN